MFNLSECVVKGSRTCKKCFEFGEKVVKIGGWCDIPKFFDIPCLCCPAKVRCCKTGLFLCRGVCEHEVLLYIKHPSCNGSWRGIGAVKCERFRRFRHYRSGRFGGFSRLS